ncbi:Uncharacterised protein [Enterobacter cloacae]|uniref:Uncharacterized protein n=1 Tax=Enterobacter cloacae TaxID=550 RepID=A0A377LZ48_ENTCL|nr:Uncharacterised protein [Enterobacter cloacae]
MRKQRVVLEHRIDVSLPRRKLTRFFTEDCDCPAGELFKTGDQPQAGGFAGARRPQHGEKLPVTNGNAHPIHRPYVAVQTGNVIKLYRVRHVLLPDD